MTTSSISKIAQDFDTLFDTGIDRAPAGFVRVMSIECEEDNMRELCKMIEQIDNSEEVFERLGNLFEFTVIEVIDTAFYLLNKFPNNPYLQAQTVCLIRYIMCDNYDNLEFSNENVQEKINGILKAIHIVNSSITLDDTYCENVHEMLNGFTTNCITILYTLGVKDKKNDVCLENLKKMYKEYLESDPAIEEYYKNCYEELI